MEKQEKPKNNSKSTPQKKAAHRSRKNIVTQTILVIALVFAIGSFWRVYTLQKNTSSLKDTAQTLLLELEAQKKQLETFKEKQATVTTLQQNQQAQNQRLHYLNDAVEKLEDNQSGHSDAWRLTKSQYLIELAQLNLHWTQSVGPAIALLENADAILKDGPQAKLFEIRKQLHHDIVQLQLIPKVDKVAILSKLTALNQSMAQLNLKDKYQAHFTKPNTSHISEAKTWQSAWQRTLSELKKIVIIHKNNKPLEPPLNFERINQIEQAIALSLQQAQWAVIQNETKLYQLSLDQARLYLNQYYLPTDKLKSIEQQLKSLARINLSPELPNLHHVMSMVQKASQQPEDLKNEVAK